MNNNQVQTWSGCKLKCSRDGEWFVTTPNGESFNVKQSDSYRGRRIFYCSSTIESFYTFADGILSIEFTPKMRFRSQWTIRAAIDMEIDGTSVEL